MDHQQISDLLEIEQLLARYAVGMSRDDVEMVMDVFDDDGLAQRVSATATRSPTSPASSLPHQKVCS